MVYIGRYYQLTPKLILRNDTTQYSRSERLAQGNRGTTKLNLAKTPVRIRYTTQRLPELITPKLFTPKQLTTRTNITPNYAVQLRPVPHRSDYAPTPNSLLSYSSNPKLFATMLSDVNVVEPRRIRITPPGEASEEQNYAGRRTIQFNKHHAMTIHRVFLGVTFLATRAWLRPVLRGNRHFTVGGGRLRQSGPRPEARLLRQPALESLTRSARTDEHSVHPHHRDFIVTPIVDQIEQINSVSETEYYDLKNHFSEPQCKMTVLPLNSGKS
ncbi:hypothetical protein F511_39844 [Dorcoceras hygrometricum]|uniref:Uncharacterized protein n=1 Tax=Dorcoceras hygrometricum TaxID=472368 RepID=A0A2Z7CLS8_9LAMI|nr:hypothetical protein F511_39844 [Dorcoceras hygrometricum]